MHCGDARPVAPAPSPPVHSGRRTVALGRSVLWAAHALASAGRLDGGPKHPVLPGIRDPKRGGRVRIHPGGNPQAARLASARCCVLLGAGSLLGQAPHGPCRAVQSRAGPVGWERGRVRAQSGARLLLVRRPPPHPFFALPCLGRARSVPARHWVHARLAERRPRRGGWGGGPLVLRPAFSPLGAVTGGRCD